jgi:hypothetical protein
MAILYTPLKINGVVSTDKTILQNLNNLATASGCFLTFDINQGKWAVIINRPGTSVASFNDSNIIGSITISEKGVSELYNSASVEFPNPSLRDQNDFVDVVIDAGLRYPNEIDSNLPFQIDCINDPVQAQYLASIELKQSRLSKIITFSADYVSLGLKAGDLIDVTSEQYGFVNKIFRISKLEESDEDVIGLSITALEYSEDVYDDAGLVRKERTRATGILLKEQNETIKNIDAVETGNQLQRLLLANAGALLLRSLFSRIAGTNQFGPATDAAKDLDKILSSFKKPNLDTVSVPASICEGAAIGVSIAHSCSGTCFMEMPAFEYPYEIIGLLEEDIEALSINGTSVPVALTGKIAVSSAGSGSMSIDTAAGTGGSTVSITVGGVNRTCVINVNDARTFNTTANTGSITEGGSVIFTVTTTGVADGTTIPYTITGSANSKVTSPALSGNITINSNTASLTVATSDDNVYTGTQSLFFTITPTLPDTPCHGTWDFEASVSVLDNESAPPTPPPDVTRQYVLTPVVWSGSYDGTTGQLKSISVLRSAFMPLPFAGEPTVNVPLTLSVTQGNPSSITVTSTRTISTVGTLGGTLLEPIITFNTVAPNTAITGTRAAIFGYY